MCAETLHENLKKCIKMYKMSLKTHYQGILKDQNVLPECLQCTVWVLQSTTEFLDPNISNTVVTEIHIFQF